MFPSLLSILGIETPGPLPLSSTMPLDPCLYHFSALHRDSKRCAPAALDLALAPTFEPVT